MSAATVAQGAVGSGETPIRHALRRLSVYLRRNAGYYLLWFVVVLLYVASFNVVPLAVGWAIDGLVDPAVAREEVIRRCWILFGLAVGGGLLRFYSRQLVFDAAREVEYEIRNDLFAHFQKLPQSFFFRWRTGDLMSRCVNDLNSVRMLLGPGLLSVAQSPILFVGAFIAMSTLSLKLAILMMLPYPGFILIMRVLGGRLYARGLAAQQSLSSMSSFVQENVAGIAVVKAYAMEQDQADRFQEANVHLRERELELVRASAAMPAVTGLLPAVGLALALWVGFGEIQAGRMGTGALFSFTIFARQLTFPTFIMGYAISLMQRGASAMQRIDEILSVEPAIRDEAGSIELPDIAGRIEFRNLTFRYDDASRASALEDVCLEIPAGTTLGVVGPVGSGKTTLASLIPRLFEVGDGQLFLDGIDVNRIRLASLRRAIAMVPQDSFLFSLPLRENIAYGLPADAPFEAITRAAERAQ
ncbi:ATP-binding cassette domain-containing protein, partial [Myxococcota bacterium]|nr:ATP-binding cassette domain-containing protein [Myxococcota bacterium]